MLNEQLPLSTANLSDAMEGANHLDFSIKPLQRHYKLFEQLYCRYACWQ